jgi:acyl-homoserine-lactone acylase
MFPASGRGWNWGRSSLRLVKVACEACAIMTIVSSGAVVKKLLIVMAYLVMLAGCGNSGQGGGGAPPGERLSAELARTSYGVVHVRAKDFAGLGFGLAYAYAEDNVCMLADSLLTVRGERSLYFGGEAPLTPARDGEYSVAIDYLNMHMFELRNEESDFFFKAYLDLDRLRSGYAAGSAEVRDLLAGYAAGYNQYLRDHGNALPKACRNATWVKPITVDDLYLLIAEKVIHASGELFPQHILAAALDDASAAPMAAAGPEFEWNSNSLGSNAIALGSDATVNGKGMLLGNPHYPWSSTDRFYQVHLTVPGLYDVMGVTLGGLPIVVIGFNDNVAWTHTVTKSLHFTTFRLPRDKSDRTGRSYLIDGVPERMTERVVDVRLRQADGSIRTKRKTFFHTRLGMLMAVPGLPIGSDDVIAFADPSRNNTRTIDQWIAMGKAGSAAQLQTELGRVLGLPWVNTVAADRAGNALFIDSSVVPHMTTDKFLSDCLVFAPLLTFDGSRSACHWGRDSDAPAGIFSAASAPWLLRRDYVANSNDGYWLSNSRHLLKGPAPLGFSPLYGPVDAEQHLRTRLGFAQLDERLAQRGRLDLNDLQALLFSNRVLAAELVLPELLAACAPETEPVLRRACTVLAAWDRKVDVDSRGALLFREFWLKAAEMSIKWRVPLDPADPVNTPRGVAPDAVAPLLGQLRAAAGRMQLLGIALDARLGDYQFQAVGLTRIPVHGGTGDMDGVYNALHLRSALKAQGYEDVVWGTSYIQLVAFSDAGVVAHGLLLYGQSTDPASSRYYDQLQLYVDKQVPRLPFSEGEIRADPNFVSTTVSEK